MSKGQKTNKSGAKPPLTGPDASNMRNELVPKIKGAVNGDTAEKREPQFRAIHDLYDETTPTRKPTEGNLERYRLVSEKAPDIIWLLRPDGQIVEVNQAAVEGYGYSRDELLKMNVRDLREPSTRHLVEEQLKKAVESNARFETLHVRKDGSVFPIDVNATIWDFGGERLILSIVRDITERKKADQEYRESAILLSMAMESSRMGAWEQDRNLDVVYWTPELEEIFGLEKGAFPGTKAAFYELIDDADREEVRAKTEEAVREKRSYSVEFRFKHADGSTRWMEGRGEAVYSEKGEPVRLYGIGIDITERKQAEEALGESERRFAEFMQNLPGLAWIKDKNGRYVFVNDAAEQTFGIAKAELYGRTDDDIFPAETAVIFKENDLKALVEKAGIQTVETLKHNDGVVHHSIVNKFPIFGPDGNAGLIGGMAVDVTDQKKAEETLRLAAEFDEAVMGNMGEGLYTVDAAGVVTSMNPAAEKLLGWTFDELRGQKMHDATHYMHRDGRAFPAEECAGFQVLKTGKTLTGHEDFFIHKDGTLFDVIYSSSPIRGENGRINGLVVVFQDITERKLLEHRIAGQNEILEAVALGKPLEEILHLTTQIIEHQLPGSMCSVLLTDEGETSLSCGSAQSLPPAYNEVIDGIAIGEAKGSCGTAAFRRQTVIVQDTATDPLWKDFRDLALLHNLRSCWSHPIISQAGKLFGTFAVYFRFPREPLGVELKLLESTARIAGIAIERKEDERKTAKLAAIVTSSDDAIISKDLNGVITSWNAGPNGCLATRRRRRSANR
jgi:PAS domain S-box